MNCLLAALLTILGIVLSLCAAALALHYTGDGWLWRALWWGGFAAAVYLPWHQPRPRKGR